MRTFVGALKVLQVRAAGCNEAEESAARVFVLVVLVQMGGKIGNATRQNGNLHLRRARVGVVALRLADFASMRMLHPTGFAVNPRFNAR